MTWMGALEEQQAQDNLRAEVRTRDEMPLVDRWEALGQEHRLVTSEVNDTWPARMIWYHFRSQCSCGALYPTVVASDGEVRRGGHLMRRVEAHRQLHHMKHLVALLLDKT